MTTKTRQYLARAESIRLSFGPNYEAERWNLLSLLVGRKLVSASDLERLHELLCFAHAWPDSPRILRLAGSELARFAQRADLNRHCDHLSESGIAGTELHYRFYHPTARWLARRWPDHVRLDWDELDNQEALAALLRQAGVFAERQALSSHDAHDLVEAMRRPDETDAAFLLGALDALEMDAALLERTYDALDLPLLLSAGETTPSRTTAKLPTRTPHYHREPLSKTAGRFRGRLDVASGAPIRFTRLPRRRANRVVDLARGALVTRTRDLDPIAYADPRDVQLAECGGGLEIAVMGVVPERRFLLECEHGFLMLKNGIPIGYGSTWALFGSCQLNFNLFPTFRGGEAAWLYARVCAVFLDMYDCDTFVVEPYQLGDENDEAIDSGAWWFYAKLGYRPRQAKVLGIARAELAKKRQRKTYRTPPRTLRKLALAPMFFNVGAKRRDVLGELAPETVGAAVTRTMAHRYGSERLRGERECRSQVAEWLAIDPSGLSQGQRLWLKRWSPLLVALGDVASWPKQARTDLREMILAKGDTDQARYVRLFDQHLRLRRALIQMME